jgi:hypothetical protein
VINRVKLILEQDEYSALLKVAVSELRNPADQARHILRQDLTRRGLLSTESQSVLNEQSQQAQDEEAE